MRAAWFPDTLAKVATLAGWRVEWVLNITDVGHLVSDGDEGEDKIEKGAKQEGKTAEQIIQTYLDDYLEQTTQLHLDLPVGDYRPRASQYINEQMILALQLLHDQKAYLLPDGIYFDSQANQTILDRLATQPGMPKTAGDNKFTGRIIENTQKNPADFALWKFVDPRSLQKWRFADNPQAKELLTRIALNSTVTTQDLSELELRWGCPGWHSECVTMISQILGRKRFSASGLKFNQNFENSDSDFEIDIHTGGIEHIPVHHKNEILQSEALGFHLSKHWVHFEHLLVNGGKMSKSLGNTYTVHDLTKRGYDPLAFKLLMFEHSYQDPMNFTWEKLEQSQNRLFNLRKEAAKIYSFRKQFQDTDGLDEDSGIWQPENAGMWDIVYPWLEILTNNLNTVDFLEKYHTQMLDLSHRFSQKTWTNQMDWAYMALRRFEKKFLKLDLFPHIPSEVYLMGQARWLAKQHKDWTKADQIRQMVADMGWQIDDYPWGWGCWKRSYTNTRD
jgi:cysteinyl-tRNA synthetase